ncbi:LysR family transcriptional regulator [Herbaspirillum sp. YR522]|uniref:LysR family transcriptional regulator n=1 Tax=Herbaspirillum sp. YR522 TaxID=1144342 RepID=UPI00026F5CB7|nr:LysR family transcriptional regulator [Herbaspirillum sp. YR522]EJN01740.1 transcriptional regulator [Herbaspirillum sp. YR522]
MNPFDSKNSDQIAALLALNEGTSFVAAGKLLQRHPTVISKRVAELESRLGVRLVERTTRQVRFTEAGLQYIQRLDSVRTALLDADAEVAANSHQAQGTLRLALPTAMGRIWLAPLLAEFVREHPNLSLHAEYSEKFVDIITEGFDAAIRIGELPDSRLRATRLCENHRILCASPSYLKQRGVPQSPSQLTFHNCLGFTGLTSFPAWKLYRGTTCESVPVRGNMTSNDNEALLAAAIAGVGILACGYWLVSREIRSGGLQQVLPDWELDAKSGVYFVRPSVSHAAAKVKTFKQWIEKRLQPAPPWLIE